MNGRADGEVGPAVAACLDAGIVELRGEDVRRFANGMFTNNVRDLPVGAVQRTAMVSDRGRVEGLLDLACLAEDRLIAVLEGVEAPSFIERYDAFVFVDDVEFVDCTGELRVCTIQGAGAADAVHGAGMPVPGPGRVAEQEGTLVLWRDRTGQGGYDLLLPRAAELPDVPQDPQAIERLRVLAGMVRYPQDFGPKSLPHEMRMREAFLHFEKGCYVGQEAIHRIDVQGKVRKQLMGLRLDAPVAAGATVQVGDKVVGTLTSPTPTEGGVIGLAVLKPPATAPGTEVVAIDGERRVSAVVCELPFDDR